MKKSRAEVDIETYKLNIAAKSLRAIKDKMQEFEPKNFRITEVWKIADHALWEMGDDDAGLPEKLA